MGRKKKSSGEAAEQNVAVPAYVIPDLHHFCDETGIAQKRVVGDLLRWFLSLERTQQSLILGLLSRGDHKAAARLVLDRMGGDMDAPPASLPFPTDDPKTPDVSPGRRRATAARKKGAANPPGKKKSTDESK